MARVVRHERFETAWSCEILSGKTETIIASPRRPGWLEFLKIRKSYAGVYVHSFRHNNLELIEQPEEYPAELFGESMLVSRTPGLTHLFPRHVRVGDQITIGLVNDASWPAGIRCQWFWTEQWSEL